MRKINNVIIFLITFITYIIGLYALKNGILVKFLTSLLILPVMLVPRMLKNFKIEIPDSLEFMYLLFIFFAYFLGTTIDLYNKIDNYDTIMHFVSGMFEAYLGFYLLKNKGNNKLITFLFILGFVSFISVGWEIFEFASDKVFKTDPQRVKLTGVDDTMKDLIVALLGSLVVYFFKKKD